MPTPTTAINGIKVTNQRKLAKMGIRTVEALLKNGRTKKGRQMIAKNTGISEKDILTWVNMADLFRVRGVASRYSMLLEAAGVDTVKELKTRKPANLHAKMVAVVKKNKRLTRFRTFRYHDRKLRQNREETQTKWLPTDKTIRDS